MLADIATQFAEVEHYFSAASEALGYNLWQMVSKGPATELNMTVHTQPALLTASYAIWKIIQARTPIAPRYLAGHSLGEYTALVCAEALPFQEAVRLVAARGQFMQEAAPPNEGAMAAIIGLEETAVVSLCEEVRATSGAVLAPANYNSIGQIVIAGHKLAVEKAVQLAKTKGAKLAVLLPVSVPSHCKLMDAAAQRLAERLATVPLQAPNVPVISNADVTPYTQPDTIRYGLVRQLSLPVRWVETIQKMAHDGVTQVVECGPGKVLTGLGKRIDKNLRFLSTQGLADLEEVLTVGVKDVS
jgi:[acyl-carrier-protein] S-malonyltransferase